MGARFWIAKLCPPIALALAACTVASAQDHRVGCDPTSWDEPVPVPAGTERVCGDGVLGSYTASCSRSCAGGCPGVSGCGPVACMTAREVCDGRVLDGASCRSLGFAGGTLACSASCDGYDSTGCSVCFSRGGTRCHEASVAGPLSELLLVPGANGVLLIWSVADGLRFAVAGADLALGPVGAVPTANVRDAVALGDGWLLAAADGRTGSGSLGLIDASGAHTAIEPLRAVSEVVLWSLTEGGAVLTTGGARGTIIRVLDRTGAIAMPTLPARASRADGGRMLLLDTTCSGALSSSGMHTEWTPAAGDFAIAFARPGVAGVQIVRDGALVTGLGFATDAFPDLDVHCGPVPATSGHGGDPAWAAAVPDEAALPGTGRIRMSLSGTRFRDTFEPLGGRAHVVTGRVAAPATPRRPMFAEHPSVTFRGYARDGRSVIGAALVPAPDGSVRVVLARGR